MFKKGKSYDNIFTKEGKMRKILIALIICILIILGVYFGKNIINLQKVNSDNIIENISNNTYTNEVIDSNIKENGELNTSGLYEYNGSFAYEYDLMRNDMIFNSNVTLYHKVITNREDYDVYTSRISELPEVNFEEDFIIIIANENIRNASENDLIISSIVSDENTIHIDLKQRENPNYECMNNVFYAVADKSKLREKVDITIKHEKISYEGFCDIEDISKNYSVKQAISDGCFVVEFNSDKVKVLSSNKNAMEEFLEKSKTEEDAFIRICFFSSEVDGVQIIKDIKYQNKIYYYQLRDLASGKDVENNVYKYLEKSDVNSSYIYTLTSGEEFRKKTGYANQTQVIIVEK